jgi:S1-C subfamily serine protease
VAINTAKFVAGQLIMHGRIRRAFLGVAGQNVTIPRFIARAQQLKAETGVLVIGVEKQSAAERAGIIDGDVIIALDDMAVRSVDDLHKLLTDTRIGASCRVALLRRVERIELQVVPEEIANAT